MSEVTQRRLREVQEFIDNKNWKRALQACEKLSKRGEKSDAFLTTRAYVLANQSEKRQQDEGKKILLELCRRNPPVADEETIRVIDSFLTKLGIATNNAVQLWERAALANPRNIKFQEQWVTCAVTQLDWLSAQKGAMMLRKLVPDDRKYEFWVIFMCCRIQKSALDDKTRKLFGTMAYRMLAKAASKAPAEAKKEIRPSSEKAILTADELYLLLMVYTEMHNWKEALELLQSPSLGLRSQIARPNLAMFQLLFLEILKESESFEQLANLCKSLLGLEEMAETASAPETSVMTDSRILWNTLVEATQRCPQPESFAGLQSLIEKYCEKHPVDRIPMIAYMDLLRKRLQLGHNVEATALQACKDAYLVFSDKQTCFEDMKDLLNTLNGDDMASFLYWANDHSELKSPKGVHYFHSFSRVNYHTIAYAYLAASPSGNSQSLMKIFSASMDQMISSVRQKSEVRQLELQVMFTAVASLVRLNEVKSNNSAQTIDHLIPALLICLFLADRHPDNYQVIILIVRLSQLLGACSISMKFAKVLSIKNLQWDTFAHVVLTRISALHPHNVHGSRDTNEVFMSPVSSLRAALSLYGRGDYLQGKLVMQGLESGSYQNANEAVEFSQSLAESICRKIYYVESQRIQRLTGNNKNPEWNPYFPPSIDKRTFEAFPNFESYKQKSMEERIRLGPLPSEQWLDAMLGLMQGWQLLVEGPTCQYSIDEIQSLYDTFYQVIRVCTAPHAHSVLQTSELFTTCLQASLCMSALSIYCSRYGIALKSNMGGHLSEKSSTGADLAIARLQQMENLYSQDLQNSKNTSSLYSTSGEYFIDAYMTLDALKMVSQFLTFCTSIKKIPVAKPNGIDISLQPQKRDVLKILANKIQSHIHGIAKQERMKIGQDGVLGTLVNLLRVGAFALSRLRNIRMANALLTDGSDLLLLYGGAPSNATGRVENNTMGRQEPNVLTEEEMIKRQEERESVGNLTIALLGEANVEAYLGEIRDSWEEALDRLVTTKVLS